MLELNRQTIFPYPIAEEPTSLAYEADRVLRRILFLQSASTDLTDISLKLFGAATNQTEYTNVPVPLSIQMWEESRSLANRFLENEELRVNNTYAWTVIKRILTGDFDPLKILKEINQIFPDFGGKDPWGLLLDLTLYKESTENEDRNHIELAGNAYRAKNI